jgi:hypothetical protein
VIAPLINGTAVVAVAFITRLFQVLKDKREKGKHEAVSIGIHNTYFHLANNTEAQVREQIKKMIEEADRRSQKKQDDQHPG